MKTAKRRIPVNYRLKCGHLLWKGTVARFINQMQRFDNEKDSLLSLVHKEKWNLLLVRAELLSTLCIDPSSYFEIAQLIALIKKYRGIDPTSQSLDPEKFSRDTWLKAEAGCSATNDNFRNSSWVSDNLLPLSKIRAYIRSVIGEEPVMDDVYDNCDFSAGASIGVHGDSTNLAAKFFAAHWSCTPSVYCHALLALQRTRYLSRRSELCELSGSPLLGVSDVRAKVAWLTGNKLAFVPKTMATHRAIAVEPLLNSFVQRGIDITLRDLLKCRAGIDLSRQEPNQEMARRGSIDGSLATIDLSSASDTIARKLVEYVLPYKWHRLLNECRSPTTTDPLFGTVQLEKFCSMGNNFCFPLETLIFAAICSASGAPKGSFRVYGDDIICPSEHAPRVLELLTLLGFVPNANKTFFEGPFRESCGADWWEGVPVRAAYAVKSWDDVRNIASFHNSSLRLWPEYLHPVLGWLRTQIPSESRLVRPHFEADGNAFNAPLDECMSSEFVWWNRHYQNWEWIELCAKSVPDMTKRRHQGFEFLWYLSVLRGGDPEKPFVFRRKTRTTSRVVSRWSLSA